MNNKPVITNIALFILSIGVIATVFSMPAQSPGTVKAERPYGDRITASLFQAQITLERPLPPTVAAQAALVYDPVNDKALYARNEDGALPIASITKIMTALVSLERVSPDDIVIISQEAVSTEGISGKLFVYEHLKVRDLVAMMMLESSNDAASALAEHVGKIYGAESYADAQDVFTRLMNEKAVILGLQKTAFKNPTGLDMADATPSNYSSARDLAKLAAYISQSPTIWNLSRDVSLKITSQEGIVHELRNINRLADEQPGILGSKTGFTDAAGGSMLTLVETPLGQPKIIVVLGSTHEDRYLDTVKLVDWLTP